MIDLNLWLSEAKKEAAAHQCGMYLIHNGVVRSTAKKEVREGIPSPKVTAMQFSWDKKGVDKALEEAKTMPGIYYVNAWLNEGLLSPGDDLMVLLVGGDIRENVMNCMNTLLDRIKNDCVTETELR